MKFSNLFDKLNVVFDLVINSDILTILVFLIVGLLILKLFNKISNKKLVLIISFVEFIGFGVVFYTKMNTLINIGNSLIDNIFLNFYFPSVYVYLFIFVFSIVVFIYTLLNRYISNTYKVLTNIYFLIFNFIFILLVGVIAENNIDIFERTSLFTNNESLVLLEISTLLFFVYLIVISLVYITNSIIIFVENRKLKPIKNCENNNINIEINLEEKDVVIPEPVLSFNDFVKRIDENNNVSSINLVPEVIKINGMNEELKNDIDLIPEIEKGFKFIDPTIYEEKIQKEDVLLEKISIINNNIIKPKDENITLNDYKLFSEMLKIVIKNNGTNNLTISDILNRNLLNMYSNEEYIKFEKILNSCMD